MFEATCGRSVGLKRGLPERDADLGGGESPVLTWPGVSPVRSGRGFWSFFFGGRLLEAIASRVEAMASRLEAIASRLEAITTRNKKLRLEAIASRLEVCQLPI